MAMGNFLSPQARKSATNLLSGQILFLTDGSKMKWLLMIGLRFFLDEIKHYFLGYLLLPEENQFSLFLCSIFDEKTRSHRMHMIHQYVRLDIIK